MAKKTKKQYSRHTENAHRKHEEMKSISSLTEEQHYASSEICSIRHELHSNQESIYKTGSSNFSKFNNYLDYKIKEILDEVGLKNNLSWNVDILPTDYEDDSNYEDDIQEIYCFMEKVNREIESFLRSVDNMYGTEYCPTGKLRG
jgi:hypothetical protein